MDDRRHFPSVLLILFQAGDQHWNTIHNWVGAPAGGAEQARLFKTKFAQTSRTGQLIDHCGIEGRRGFGIDRHEGLLNRCVGLGCRGGCLIGKLTRSGSGSDALGLAGELGLDAVVGAGLGGLVGHTDAVEDGAVV